MEKLYNNIMLPDDFACEMSSPQNVPYLKTPPEVINITVGRQLFVDDFLVEETDLVPEYHKAVKYAGNPVLKAETEWEIAQSPVACPKSGGVWYDEEEHIFKMWYEAGWLRNMCYATSKDGIHWERPNVGEKPGTNLILTYDGYEPSKFFVDETYLRPDSTTVFIDYECDRSERYKLFLRNPGGKRPGYAAVSSDGIHFRDFRPTGSVYDRTTIFYNPFRKKWVYSIREGVPTDETGKNLVRVRDYRECDNYLDGASWTGADVHRWLTTDELDKPNPYVGITPELYNVDCVGYESIMLGMFQIFYGPQNKACEETGAPKITELIPMYSRDGFNFSRPSRDSIINASMYKGSWDRGYVQSVGGVTIINGDELLIYYVGFGGDENFTHQSWITNGMYKNGATGLAKLRRDGFVSMNGHGTLLTRKMTMSGKKELYVNAVGKVRAEIIDNNGKTVAVSHAFDGDSTKARLGFDDFVVSSLNGQVFRLKFCVEGKLYAFGFADENGEFGGARAAGVVK
ncbi:MAG: glycosyl hydrolase family 32 [Clostridia bacterium]|nr:glycosyl hydrolase family 32 [Clostridia bacterium]